MRKNAKIQIYCNYEHPGGIERVSLRLRALLGRSQRPAGLISLFGDPIFGHETAAFSNTSLAGQVLIFSRKGDLREMGARARKARLIYWRHVPVTQRGYKRLIEIAFIAWLSRIGQIVCVCDDLAAEVVALPFVNANNVRACYSPIGRNVPPLVDIREPSGNGPLKLVYFGRPGTQKRLDLVLWQVDNARYNNVDVELTVYGYDGVPEGGEMDGVTYAGIVEKPTEAMRAADAVILISEYEGFPTVMVEAALTGTPIIANDFRTGRADFERLIGPVTGIDAEDPLSLAQALSTLPTGQYNMSALSDEVLAEDWLRVLDAAR
ncbi:glycosyltransferase family 4 protein [Maritimibacter dapengensis]|uniref:Glycosyltransferase family 4 protein n=1 Tax=Maritimibacter dapengensis TaxID=2836868 RepID=A0ABS6T166_9RHOB|nr:glycosyltransferase family 4 protein [Maritimibacter dapengensis]MBV7378735.1 glycosyltransferase family 4 protein [Maritimibacter dapengensis]